MSELETTADAQTRSPTLRVLETPALWKREWTRSGESIDYDLTARGGRRLAPLRRFGRPIRRRSNATSSACSQAKEVESDGRRKRALAMLDSYDAFGRSTSTPQAAFGQAEKTPSAKGKKDNEHRELHASVLPAPKSKKNGEQWTLFSSASSRTSAKWTALTDPSTT